MHLLPTAHVLTRLQDTGFLAGGQCCQDVANGVKVVNIHFKVLDRDHKHYIIQIMSFDPSHLSTTPNKSNH